MKTNQLLFVKLWRRENLKIIYRRKCIIMLQKVKNRKNPKNPSLHLSHNYFFQNFRVGNFQFIQFIVFSAQLQDTCLIFISEFGQASHEFQIVFEIFIVCKCVSSSWYLSFVLESLTHFVAKPLSLLAWTKSISAVFRAQEEAAAVLFKN